MADNEEQLAIDIIAKLNNLEKQMAKASGITARAYREMTLNSRKATKQMEDDAVRSSVRINQALSNLSARTGDFSGSFGRLAPIGAGIAAALGANELKNMADTWSDLTSRVNLAVGAHEDGADVMQRLGVMARTTYSSLEQTTESYLANAGALKELGYSTEEQLNYTEALNNALVVSAAKGQRAESVQNALAKAMAGGKLSGDELNTVITQGGRVAEALAAGLGVGVNQLRKLGAEGRITSKDVFTALTSQMETLRKEAASMPATIADGAQLLKNALLEYVGNADQATGVSAKISEALVIMADNFDKTADVALQFAGVLAGAMLGRSVFKMVSTLGLGGKALLDFSKALMAARTAGGLAASFGGIGAAAGPMGLLIGGAVVGSLVLYNNTVGVSSEASKTYATALKQVEEAAKNAAGGIDEASEKIARGMPEKLADGVAFAEEEIRKATDDIINHFDHMLRSVDRSVIKPEEIKKVEDLKQEFENGSINAKKLASGLDEITRSNPQWDNFASQVMGFVNALSTAVSTASLLKAQLADVTTGSFRSAKDDKVKVDIGAIEAETYEREALRRAALGKQQLALENEIAKVRNESVRDGKKLTDEQIERIAKANIAGDAARSADGKKTKTRKERDDDYERLTKSIVNRTTAMIAETEVQRGLNPLIEDYGYAVEKARAEHDLLTAAEKAGVKVTPELKDEISKLAEQYALASVEANKLSESQDKIRQNAEEMAAFQKDLTRGIVDGFVQGKKAADIFADALSKIGNKLLDLALNGLFDVKTGGGSGGGILGALTGFITGKYANGTNFATGGLSLVGERGPELVNLPRGSQVVPNHQLGQTMGGMSAQQNVHVTVGVSVEQNGNLEAYVQNIAQSEAGKAAQQGIRKFSESSEFQRLAGRGAKNALGKGWVR